MFVNRTVKVVTASDESAEGDVQQYVVETGGQQTVTTWTTTTTTTTVEGGDEEFHQQDFGLEGHEIMAITSSSGEWVHAESDDDDSDTNEEYTVTVTSKLTDLLGDQLLCHSTDYILTRQLQGKIIGLYFSGHWCPPSRQFTPKLVEFYNNMSEEMRKHFEIVFISWDRDENEFNSYFNEMPWLALPYSDRARKDTLGTKYDVEGIPCLIVLSSSGQVITTEGVEEVSSGGYECFLRWASASQIIITTIEYSDELHQHHDDMRGRQILMTQAASSGSSNHRSYEYSSETHTSRGSSSVFVELFGNNLLRHEFHGCTKSTVYVSVEEIAGKTIGLYFSGHWCPPSRQFTPKLVEFYNSLSEEMRKHFEIVFISWDRDENEFNSYFNEMPWLALPYSDRAREQLLRSKYGVTGIPCLIILSSSGQVITMKGVHEVSNNGAACFAAWMTASGITLRTMTIVTTADHQLRTGGSHGSAEQVILATATSGKAVSHQLNECSGNIKSGKFLITSETHSSAGGAGGLAIAERTVKQSSSSEAASKARTVTHSSSAQRSLQTSQSGQATGVTIAERTVKQSSSGQQALQSSSGAAASKARTVTHSSSAQRSVQASQSGQATGVTIAERTVKQSSSGQQALQSSSSEEASAARTVIQSSSGQEALQCSGSTKVTGVRVTERIVEQETPYVVKETRVQVDRKHGKEARTEVIEDTSNENVLSVTRNRRFEPNRSRRCYLIWIGVCCLLAILFALLIIFIAWRLLPHLRRSAAVAVIEEKKTPEIALKAMFTTSYFIAGANQTENITDVDDMAGQINLKLSEYKIRVVNGFFWNVLLSRRYRREMCPNGLLGNILQLNILASLTNQCTLSDKACTRQFMEGLKTKIYELGEIFVKIRFMDGRSRNMRLKLCILTDMDKIEDFGDVSSEEEIPITVVVPIAKEAIRKTLRPPPPPPPTRTTTRTTTTASTTTTTRKQRRRTTTTITMAPVKAINPLCFVKPASV
ncbi:unnamed protein product, partial [Adineta ricciae]